jgi:hypothetical protein
MTKLTCNEGHIMLLLNALKVKSVSVNTAMNAKEEAKEDGMVNVATGCSNEGWKAPMQPGLKWRLQKR